MRRVLFLVCVLSAGVLVSVPSAAAASSDRLVAFHRWEGGPALRAGSRAGLKVRHGALMLTDSTKRRGYRGTAYDVGTWTAAPVSPGFAFTQLVASWSASTPRNSWVEVRVRVASAAG